MKIAVFGCGYVGLTTAVGLAELGNDVMAVDIDPTKIASLKRGVVPFHEPKMESLLQCNITAGRLDFSLDGKAAILESETIFCAVGTPAKANGEIDLRAIYKVAEMFAEVVGSKNQNGLMKAKISGKSVFPLRRTFGGHTLRNPKTFINKSTVPVCENQKIHDFILKKISRVKNQTGPAPFSYLYTPEFLREGSALEDFFKPDRIIVGLAKNEGDVHKLVEKLYSPLTKKGVPLLFTDLNSAEMIKYASNVFLATKISFINEISDLCKRTGGNISDISKGIGLDKRIGPGFLQAGIGFGGSCLPKDLKTLIAIGEKSGVDLKILKAVEEINNVRPLKLINELKKKLSVNGKKADLKNKKIAIWGAAFKPNTDDLREAPAVTIIKNLLSQKAKIAIYDPVALKNLQKISMGKIQYGRDQYEVLENADALLVLTEWEEFRKPDFAKMKQKMAKPLILDGRIFFDSKEIIRHGFDYVGMG